MRLARTICFAASAWKGIRIVPCLAAGEYSAAAYYVFVMLFWLGVFYALGRIQEQDAGVA